jgi:enamine deaminase RidA (YjgF/YER057c/UK114 family)
MPNSSITRYRPSARMNQITIHGDIVYLAGQVIDDLALSVTEQTRAILAKIDSLLAEAGTDRTRALSVTIWLTDMSAFGEMNAVWETWVTPEHAPVRACVESRLAMPGCKVEISLIAAL